MLVYVVCKSDQINAKLSSFEVANRPRLHIEHIVTHDKTIQTRTYLVGVCFIIKWNVLKQASISLSMRVIPMLIISILTTLLKNKEVTSDEE